MQILVGLPRAARARLVELAKNWPWFVLVGLVMLCSGIMALISPLVAVVSLDQIVGWSFVLSGFVQLLQMFQSRSTGHSFLWSLAWGLVLVVLGGVLLRHPVETPEHFSRLLATLVGLYGLLKLVYAARIKPAREWLWMLASGLLSLGIAVLLVLNLPILSHLTPSLLLAIELSSSGLWMVLTGFGLKDLDSKLVKQVL